MDSIELKQLVKALAGEGALAWSWKHDASLVVIDWRGAKRYFDAEACQKALKKMKNAQKRKGKGDEQAG